MKFEVEIQENGEMYSTYEVEAESEEEATQSWFEGKLVDQFFKNRDSTVLCVEKKE